MGKSEQKMGFYLTVLPTYLACTFAHASLVETIVV